jgi:ubiquinone/menaquinone biosynthesis C-methylase UbiE
VGCGSGTITLDVAAAIYPGQVTGIDPDERPIAIAQEWARASRRRAKVDFAVGDSHNLDFPDRTFDVVYSHTVIHFFLDPVGGLKEQKRVAKPGGWVIASGVRDYVCGLRYPACPHWDKVWEACSDYYQSLLSQFQASGKRPADYVREQTPENPSAMFFYDMQAGRKCLEWFSQAGLADVRLLVKPSLRYQGSPAMKPGAADLLVIKEPENSAQQQVAVLLQRLVRDSLLSQDVLDRATAEARAWYQDARAFHFWPEVFIAGRA